MSAFNSMSGTGSAIGITADIRLNRAELVSDIAAARQTIQTEFSSMQINFGASLLESVRSVAPEITATIAQAVSAGMAGGGGSFAPVAPGGGGGGLSGPPGVTGGFQSGNYIPSLGFAGMGGTLAYSQGFGVGMPVQYATPGELMADNAAYAAVQQQRIASGKVFQRTGMAAGGAMADAPSMEDIEEGAAMENRMYPWQPPAEAEENTFLTGTGMGTMGRLFSGFMLLRAGRSAEQYYEQNADISARQFEAENMPGRTESERLRRGRAEVSADQQALDATTGFMPFLSSLFSAQTGGPGTQQGAFSLYSQNAKAAENTLSYAQIDLSNQQANTDKENLDAAREKVSLENQIYEARRKGNTADAEHLELLEKINDKTKQMNDRDPGSGTTWFNTVGQQMLGDQANDAAISKLDTDRIKRMDFATQMDVYKKIAGGDVRGADRELFVKEQFDKYAAAEKTYEIESGQHFGDVAAAVTGAQKTINNPNATPAKESAHELVNQAQLSTAAIGAYDAQHHSMAFTSGMETWRRMQTAGYGSTPGDNSGARRVYAAAGGSSAGNPLSLGSPSAPNWGSGLAHGGAGGGMISNSTIHGFDGMHATHPIGAGIGFAGFHPDMTHRMMEHNDTSGHRTTSEKSTGGIMGLIDKLNTKLDNAPKLAVVKISG